MRLLLSLLLCVVWVDASAAVRAWFDRDTVTLGETVTLNVEIDGMLGSQPDLSGLGPDFKIVGSSSSAQMSVVNQQRQSRTLWAVALQPLTAGTLGVPALTIDGQRTDALQLTVLPAPRGSSGHAGDDAFLEVEADPLAPYVQQQVNYTVRLFYAVQLLEGQLDEPQVDGARLQRIGNDVSYQRVIDGRRYQVVERRYALAPEHSGALEVPAPQFRGRSAGSGYFGGGGGTLFARGNALTLDVQPRPASAPTPWLPARELRLDDESGDLPASSRVGEPLTLSLRLSALGLMAEQLPELQLPDIEGAQVYPDRESSQTVQVDGGFRGERVRKFAIVPNRPGPLQLPAVRIGWWNTATDSLEYAELPARDVEILPALPGAPAAATPITLDSPGSAILPAASAPGALPAAETLRAWQWSSAALLVLWLATLAWAWTLRRAAVTRPLATPMQPAQSPAIAAARPESLAAALATGDPRKIAQALRESSQEPVSGLDEVAGRLGDPLQAQCIRQLERALYAETDTIAVVEELRRLLRSGLSWKGPDKDSANDAGALPPLYR